MSISLCRSSIYLFISVCYTGSGEEAQYGKNLKIPNKHQPIIELFIEMNDYHLPFPSSTQTHRAGSNINTRMQDEPHSSSSQGDRARRRRRHRHHHQTPPSNQPATTVQQILHPGNLLRRLLPSSSLFNSDSHTS